MLIRSDVIRLQICKNTDIKGKATHAVQHQPLRGHLHNDCIQPCIHHFPKALLNDIRLRCGIHRRNMLLTDDRLNRTDQAYLIAGVLQNRFDHIGRCSLSLRSGNSNRL